jgi:hypothetical protein
MKPTEDKVVVEMRKKFAENQKKDGVKRVKTEKDFKKLLDRLNMYFFNEIDVV